MRRRILESVFLFVAMATLAGCGGRVGHRVSGKITFKGQPVPAGKIYFRPNAAQNATGSTGYADIHNGAYDTAAAGGHGAPSGKVTISIEGIDPSKPPPKAEPDVTATVLFPQYEIEVDLPAADSTKDIDVPESAAKGPTQPKGAKQLVIP